MPHQVEKQEQTILHPYFEDALKKIVYDAVRTVFEHVQHRPERKQAPAFFGIEICEEETGLAKSTIYRNTSKNLMPHYRRDGKLVFKRDEIYAWMTENRVETAAKLSSRMDEQLLKRRGRK